VSKTDKAPAAVAADGPDFDFSDPELVNLRLQAASLKGGMLMSTDNLARLFGEAVGTEEFKAKLGAFCDEFGLKATVSGPAYLFKAA